MVLVIAIIVILAAVILMSVANIIEDAQTGASKVSEHNVQTSSVVNVIEQYI
jgi:FlaG/FlaF family flagellin (archaellin)